MCARTCLLSLFLVACFLALAAMPASAQSSSLSQTKPFVDSEVYQVPGSLLNQWRTDSLKQEQDLKAAWLQVRISQESFERYKSSITRDELKIGIGGFLAGAASGFILRLSTEPK
jgi:hypothetical protein